ncbi:MAG: hypothetical protein AAF467_27915 [Actinomycetota bacterium]
MTAPTTQRPAGWPAPITPDLDRTWPAIAYQLDHLYGLINHAATDMDPDSIDVADLRRGLDELATALDDAASEGCRC